jgi:ribosomal protein S27E
MTGKVMLYIGAAILFLIGLVLLFFGFVFFTASSSAGGSATTGAVLGILALIFIGGGALLILGALRGQKTEVVQQVTMKVDLPGDTKFSQVTCRNCGGTLKPENIKLVAGAPMVECPFCGTTYQLTEEPKW